MPSALAYSHLPQFYEPAPLIGEWDGTLGGEVEADNHRVALGIGQSVIDIDESLVHLHTLRAEALNPRLYLYIISQAGLAHHIGLDAHKHQIHTSPIYPIAQNVGVELHLAQIEVLLQVDVVDVPQRVGIGKTLLYLGNLFHSFYKIKTQRVEEILCQTRERVRSLL